MNRILILAIIMTTFFMEGCVSNNEEAISYFDSVYLPIQEVVELDNIFQESLQGQLIAADEISFKDSNDSLNEEDYTKSINEIDSTYLNLSNYLSKELVNISNTTIYNNESGLQRAAVATLTDYTEVVKSDFSEMILIIKKDSITEADNDRFNQLLKQSTNRLNTSLDLFYNQALEYGDRYEIDLEYEDE